MGRGREVEAMNLKQVAAHLGVHYMTAYRYVRSGQIDATKVGTSWVVELDALDRFVTERDASADGDAGTRARTDWTARLVHALVTGDEAEAWRVVQQALVGGRSPTECYVELLGSALREISSPDPDSGSSKEYLATATASRIVARLGARFRRPGRSRGTVVFGAPRGELHSLPIAIVADLVRIDGFTCLELGANVPPDVFADAARHAPRLLAVGIGVTTVANIDSVRATIAAVTAASPGTPVLLGGQAVLSPEIAQLTGATHWASDGRQALAILNQLDDEVRRPSRADDVATGAAW